MLTPSPDCFSELRELVGRLCNEALDAAGQRRLNELLERDDEARAWYLEYVDLHASLRAQTQSLTDEDFALLEVQAALKASSGLADDGLSVAGSSSASAARGAASYAGSPLSAPVSQRAGRMPATRRIVLVGLATAALVLIGVNVLMRSSAPSDRGTSPDPPAREVAKGSVIDEMKGSAMLSGVVGARWAGEHLELPEGDYFEPGQRLELVEGLAEIQFRGGGRVLLQGPAAVLVEGDGSARVTLGRFAVVAGPSTNPFRLSTATAELTSRDGEFGAEVDVSGSVVTEVYRGGVEISFDRAASPSTEVELTAGQGARIDALSRRVTPLKQPYDLHFVRYLPQREMLVNLADVVAGGNGVRRPYHEGIRLLDGAPTDDYGAPAQGTGRYIRTSGREFVDGVFVPDGKLGSVQIDSIGREFKEFPATSNDCWGGAIIARRPQEEKTLPFIKLEFHGDISGYVNWLHIATHADELSPQGLGMIGMHSNCGITFDMHTIREKYPHKKVVRFRALVGNLESKTARYEADAWVLVDGKLRYRRERFSREDGPQSIDVAITDQDRFLVLAVTDAGNTAYDWVAFGDPVIECKESRGPTAKLRTVPSTPASSRSDWEFAGIDEPLPGEASVGGWSNLPVTVKRPASRVAASQFPPSSSDALRGNSNCRRHDMMQEQTADLMSADANGGADAPARNDLTL